jgi:hypothetical protein
MRARRAASNARPGLPLGRGVWAVDGSCPPRDVRRGGQLWSGRVGGRLGGQLVVQVSVGEVLLPEYVPWNPNEVLPPGAIEPL